VAVMFDALMILAGIAVIAMIACGLDGLGPRRRRLRAPNRNGYRRRRRYGNQTNKTTPLTP
jgi:hypothetical protein